MTGRYALKALVEQEISLPYGVKREVTVLLTAVGEQKIRYTPKRGSQRPTTARIVRRRSRWKEKSDAAGREVAGSERDVWCVYISVNRRE